jgi:hypothetical protein
MYKRMAHLRCAKRQEIILQVSNIAIEDKKVTLSLDTFQSKRTSSAK